MADSEITWCDKTWNVTGGCSPVSEGCQYCWAAKLTATRFKKKPRYAGLTKNGCWTGKIKLFKDRLDWPLHRRIPRRIFICSQSDLFHPDVPFEFINEVFDRIYETPRHTYIILTKRPLQMKNYFENDYRQIPDNVQIGVSVENQRTADERIPLLLQLPAAHRIVSFEPLLEEVNIGGIAGLYWGIIGCESGPERRPCKVEWARKLAIQLLGADAKVFVKQIPLWYGKGRYFETAPEAMLRCGEGRYRTRVVHNVRYFPKCLRIQQY